VSAALCAVLFITIAVADGRGQTSNSAYSQAAKDIQEGRVADAEATLKAALRADPSDLPALSLMGVVLDSQGRYPEAQHFYDRARQLAPRSTAVLNNLGNHYLAAGNLKEAQRSFREVIAIDPHHVNANLHLAAMSVEGKHGLEALAYLGRLPRSAQTEPVAQLLKGQALALAGRCDAAVSVLDPLQSKTGEDSHFSFSIGLAYSNCQRYDRAENSFSQALRPDPTNFDILYNLGLAARRAGHLDRAQQALETALHLKPDDPDALYAFADLLVANRGYLMATALLYRAQQVAPARADVLLLLAHATEALEYYDETAATYEKYLKLRPVDEIARREHGFSLIRAGKIKDGIPELQQFVLRHPKDARGQYELAMAEAFADPGKAIGRLDQALTLDPHLLPARYARAVLNYQKDRLDRSLEDFLALQKLEPQNPRLLDWQAQIYLRRGQAQQAAPLLTQALELAPRDPVILMHYSKALRKLGRTEEMNAVLADFKQGAASQGEHHARKGLFDFLDLPLEQQDTKYLESLQTAVETNPNDVLLKARLAKTLLEKGRTEAAIGVFRQVLATGPDAEILTDCGRALVQHEQYALAAEFLERVPDAQLDLAIAVFHSISAEAGLAKLDNIPVDERSGDYYLLRAQILDSMGKTEEAAESLNRGIRAAPTRSDMYFQAAAFLIKHHQRQEAVGLLADATRRLPDAAELWMARAIVLELLKRSDEALQVLAQVQSRWPEWDLPYLVNGIILQNELKPAEAKQMLDIAIALGTREADAYYYEALAITTATPDNLADAQKAISQALALNAEDPAIRVLAGKILLDRKDYSGAVEQLLVAVQLQPSMVRAHYLLRTAYSDLGDTDKVANELKQIERITKENTDPDQLSSSMERLLFGVRPPVRSFSLQ
jgi:tetratricopeptide (TPR) repeat protein